MFLDIHFVAGSKRIFEIFAETFGELLMDQLVPVEHCPENVEHPTHFANVAGTLAKLGQIGRSVHWAVAAAAVSPLGGSFHRH